MDRTGREDRKDRVNPVQKYIRLQEIGLACWLAWPVAMILADMYGLASIIPIMSVLLLMVGVVIFAIGHVGRQELKTR